MSKVINEENTRWERWRDENKSLWLVGLIRFFSFLVSVTSKGKVEECKGWDRAVPLSGHLCLYAHFLHTRWLMSFLVALFLGIVFFTSWVEGAFLLPSLHFTTLADYSLYWALTGSSLPQGVFLFCLFFMLISNVNERSLCFTWKEKTIQVTRQLVALRRHNATDCRYRC